MLLAPIPNISSPTYPSSKYYPDTRSPLFLPAFPSPTVLSVYALLTHLLRPSRWKADKGCDSKSTGVDSTWKPWLLHSISCGALNKPSTSSWPQFPQVAWKEELDWVKAPQCLRISRVQDPDNTVVGTGFQGHPRDTEARPCRVLPERSPTSLGGGEAGQALRPARPGRLTVSGVLHEPAQRLQVRARSQVQICKHRHAGVTWPPRAICAGAGPRPRGMLGFVVYSSIWTLPLVDCKWSFPGICFAFKYQK